MPKKPSRYSDAKAMKVHQFRATGLSWHKIHEQMNIAVSTAISWDKIVMEDPELLKKAETEKHPAEDFDFTQVKNGKAKMASPTISAVMLKEDNDFLRWWNQGERRGWVDRLLSEVQR